MRTAAASLAGRGRRYTGWVIALSVAIAPSPANAASPDLRRVDAGLPFSGQWRNGFDLVDLDGDGVLDLVHGPLRKGDGKPRLFRGLGDGTFEPWSAAHLPEVELDYGDAAAADFDGDGSMDLAFAVHFRGVTALRGEGRGQFDPWPNGTESAEPTESGANRGAGLGLLPPGEGGFSSRALEIGDWNADGRLDIAALGEGGGARLRGARGFAVFLNRGPDGWQRIEGPDDRGFGDSLVLIDVDRDGRLDAVVAPRRVDDRALLRRQTEDGSWALEEIDAARPDSYFPAVVVVERGDDSSAPAIALSYVQRQGDDWFSGVDILESTPSGWKRTEVARYPPGREIRALAAGDLDGDGRTDLATADQRGEVRIYLGRKSSPSDNAFKRLRSKELERAGDGCSAYGARMADLDSDGRDELVLSFAGEPKAGVCPTGGSLQIWTAAAN